uniref:Uncharacterized protein n=1 Tax=Anguilla anguilla TaxID=7936 RepID=A0A0E9XE65_ANGAN
MRTKLTRSSQGHDTFSQTYSSRHFGTAVGLSLLFFLQVQDIPSSRQAPAVRAVLSAAKAGLPNPVPGDLPSCRFSFQNANKSRPHSTARAVLPNPVPGDRPSCRFSRPTLK